jgi:hypothetical protein
MMCFARGGCAVNPVGLSEWPHSPQYFLSGMLSVPQEGQIIIASPI